MANQLSNVLTFLRTRAGMSQQELADRLHISRTCIANYEQGTRKPNPEKLEIIADFFNVTVDFLCGRNSPTFSVEEAAIIQGYSNAPDTIKAAVRAILEPYMVIVKGEQDA